MTEYVVNRAGKLLFPHLARDQRKHKMFIIIFVLAASLFTAGALAIWMTYSRR